MQANAVEQLGFIGRHQVGQIGDALHIGVWVVAGSGLCCGLVNRHALQHHAHLFQQRTGREPQVTQRLTGLHH